MMLERINGKGINKRFQLRKLVLNIHVCSMHAVTLLRHVQE